MFRLIDEDAISHVIELQKQTSTYVQQVTN